MIIHPIEDSTYSSSYSSQQDESPEVILLQRLVWVQYKSHWWPALLFQDYSELQNFVADEMDPIMKAQMAAAIMRQMQQRRNTKVARLLGMSTIEIVEITTKYHEFYDKIPEFVPKAISRSRYGREKELFLDMHRALDQVEVIISEISKKPFSLLPGMGTTTWLQKAQAQVEGGSTYYPELQGRTESETSIRPVARERPMADLLQSTQRPVPSHIHRHNLEAHRGVSNQDVMVHQYKALSRLAHDSDTQSVGSILSTGVIPPERTSSGKAVRAIEQRGSESTQPANNLKNHSSSRKGSESTHQTSSRKKQSSGKQMSKPLPSIKEVGAESRDEKVSGNRKKVSDSREPPATTSLRKMGRAKAPLVHKRNAGILRPPMHIAKKTNRVAVPTVSQGEHFRRVQEYLLRQEMSVASEQREEAEMPREAKEIDRAANSNASHDGNIQRVLDYVSHQQMSRDSVVNPTASHDWNIQRVPEYVVPRQQMSVDSEQASYSPLYTRETDRVAAPKVSHEKKTRRVQEYLLHEQISFASEQEEAELPLDADPLQILPIATPVSQDSISAASRDSIRQNNAGNVIQVSQPQARHLQHPPRPCDAKIRHPPRSCPTQERKDPSGDSFSVGSQSEAVVSLVDHRSTPESSQRPMLGDLDPAGLTSNNFDDYLTETEKKLELLIKKERESLRKQQQRSRRRSSERHQRSRRSRSMEFPEFCGERGHKHRGRSLKHRQRAKELVALLDGCFLADDDQYEPSVATTYDDETKSTKPGLSDDRINKMMASRRFTRQERPRAAKIRHKKKGSIPIEILPGLEGDDIAPGLSEKINKLIAKKGFFSRQDVLLMIEELEAEDDESISINLFDELARQRIENLRR